MNKSVDVVAVFNRRGCYPHLDFIGYGFITWHNPQKTSYKVQVCGPRLKGETLELRSDEIMFLGKCREDKIEEYIIPFLLAKVERDKNFLKDIFNSMKSHIKGSDPSHN